MFAPKFELLDTETKKIILQEAVDNGAYDTSHKWFEKAGMSQIGLYTRLKKYVSGQNGEVKAMTTPGKDRKGRPEGKKEKKLTTQEKEYLDRLALGTVSTDEMGRFVAVRVFEKMLKNPDDFKFLDFFRVQLLQLKERESKTKEKWGNELLAKMFAGKLPPSKCPDCGHDFMETPVITGEIITLEEGNDESIRPTESI